MLLEHPARPAATRVAIDAVAQTACLRVSTGAVGALKHVLVPEVLLPGRSVGLLSMRRSGLNTGRLLRNGGEHRLDQYADCQTANDSGDCQDRRVDKGDGGESVSATMMSWPALCAIPPSTDIDMVENKPLLCAATIIAQDSTPPAMLKTNICGLAKSMVEHATLISISMKAGLAPMRSSAKRTIALPRPSLTPVMVTGSGTRTSR